MNMAFKKGRIENGIDVKIKEYQSRSFGLNHFILGILGGNVNRNVRLRPRSLKRNIGFDNRP